MSKPARIWVLVVGVIGVLLVFPAAPSHARSQPPALQAAATYWYYYPSTKQYYPEVQSCAEPWIPVPPRNP